MKQILALMLTALLLCGTLTPSVLAADETALPSNNAADAMSDENESIGGDTAAAKIVLTSFDEPERTDAVAFAVGITREELAHWFADTVAGFTGYDAEGNPYDLVSGAWSLDDVNTGKVGMYYASAAPDLGEDYTLADGASLPRQLCTVSMQTPGEPDLNCCVAGRGFLHFPWILSAKQQEQLCKFAVWLQQDGGAWTILSDGFLFTSEDLQLSQRIFKSGSTYALKVTYPGGQTGVLKFQYDGELSIIDYSTGDRDGGDTGGGGSGTGTQPAPTQPQTPVDSSNPDSGDNTPAPDTALPTSNEIPPNTISTPQELQELPFAFHEPQEEPDSPSGEIQPVQAPAADKPALVAPAALTELAAPLHSGTTIPHEAENTSAAPDSNDTQPEKSLESQAAAPIQESYSPGQTVISGLRLRDLCADEASTVFGSGDLTVSIPSKLLLELNLSDSDTLSVRLTQPESNKIMLTVETSGKSIKKLSGTVVRLRYKPQSKNTEITVRNETGELITDAAYGDGLLRFTADAAGTYTILEVSHTQEAQKSVVPLLPVSGGLILAAVGIPFFKRKRHG